MEKNKDSSKYEKYIFYFIIIDLLFLPYIRVLSIKASMIFLLIWYIDGGIKKAFTKNNLYTFLSFVVLSTSSIFIGILYAPEEYGTNNFVLSNVQILTITWFSFLFLNYFRYQFLKNNFKINKILMAYLFVAFLFAVLYWVNPQLYFDIRQIWTLGNQKTIVTEISSYRFTHIASETNNFSIMVIGIMAYLRFVEKLESRKMVFIYLISFFLVITTMSTTGMITYAFYFSMSVLYTRKRGIKVRLSNMIWWISFIILSLILVVVFSDKFELFFDSNIIQAAISRYERYIDAENYTGSRIAIWTRLLQDVNIFKYILIGRGTTILANGLLYRPHSGHLYLIYGYGMIAYIIYMLKFFRFRKSMLKIEYFAVAVPFLVIFTMNTMIGDLRCTFLYVILLASIIDTKTRRNMGERKYLAQVS